MLSWMGETMSTPGSKGVKLVPDGSARRTNEMPISDSSNACVGGGSFRKLVGSRLASEVMAKRPLRLDKRDLVDLLQSSHSTASLLQRRFTQECHAFLTRRALDFRRRPLVQNHLTDLFAQIQKLMNRGSAAKASATAFETPGALIEGDVAPLFRVEPAFDEIFVRIFNRNLAVLASDTHQPLRQ